MMVGVGLCSWSQSLEWGSCREGTNQDCMVWSQGFPTPTPRVSAWTCFKPARLRWQQGIQRWPVGSQGWECLTGIRIFPNPAHPQELVWAVPRRNFLTLGWAHSCACLGLSCPLWAPGSPGNRTLSWCPSHQASWTPPVCPWASYGVGPGTGGRSPGKGGLFQGHGIYY